MERLDVARPLTVRKVALRHRQWLVCVTRSGDASRFAGQLVQGHRVLPRFAALHSGRRSGQILATSLRRL